MQTVYDDDHFEEGCILKLPNAKEEVLPGIEWGFFYDFFTPAYWASRVWLHRDQGRTIYKLGNSLVEEVVACLLGGHGMKSEVAIAAFERIRDLGFLHDSIPHENKIRRVLEEPLDVGGRKISYRYPRQKSKYLHIAISQLRSAQPPTENGPTFRNWLMNLPGIGPKTASWITRNWLNSDEVHRAGILCGLFSRDSNIATDYFDLEKRFLRFARALGESAAMLDAIMWRYMKDLSNTALEMLQRI
jgi:thermostable 8-oxoguanine DNA glycosylase